MDLMWLLTLFGLFMMTIVTVFFSSVLNGYFKTMDPSFHIFIIALLSLAYTDLFLNFNLLWLISIIVTISYLIPLGILKAWMKGIRIERER